MEVYCQSKILGIKNKFLDNDYGGFNKVDYLHMTSNETIEGVQLKSFNRINHEKLIIDRAKSNEIPIQTLGQFKDELFQIGKENIKVKELKAIFDKGLDDLFN